jgi:hypothetical protein
LRQAGTRQQELHKHAPTSTQQQVRYSACVRVTNSMGHDAWSMCTNKDTERDCSWLECRAAVALNEGKPGSKQKHQQNHARCQVSASATHVLHDLREVASTEVALFPASTSTTQSAAVAACKWHTSST